MSFVSNRHRLKPALLACAAGLSLFAAPAWAQQVDSNKLLEVMVRKGLVSRAEADAMIAEAAVSPAAPQPAAIPAGGTVGDVQTVPYIPQTVRNQIKAELREELSGQAQAQGWAVPGEVAEWTKRITLSGDIRVRGEGVRFDKPKFNAAHLQTSGNFPDFPDFAAINAGPGYNENRGSAGYLNPPYLNTTEDRTRARIRARLGITAKIDSWISGEVRVATGSDRSPVSTNQSLGGNGEFGKYAIWLDRANIRLTPVAGADVAFGRFANPFWTSELLFDEDLNFDGVAASGTAKVGGLSVFGTLGAFPIFNTDFNFSSNTAGSFKSKDKYLLAGQIGAEFAPSDDLTLKLAGGYFRFEKVAGEFSSPCAFNQDVCDTDATRPAFQQFGNSLFALRNIVADPAATPGTSPAVQYYGLASKFEVLDVHGTLDLNLFSPVGIRLEGDFVKNLGFDRARVAALAVNPSSLGPSVSVQDPAFPNDPTKTVEQPGPFAGSDIGWQANLMVGMPQLTKPGDWNVALGYRHLESDAVLDALADSDFHFGGTNAKGFILGGWYAIGKNTHVGARWLSSDSIAGPTNSNDVVQLDLTTKF